MGDPADKAAISGIRNEPGVPATIREGLSETVESLPATHAESIKRFLDLAINLKNEALASPSAVTKATYSESVKANIDAIADDIMSGLEEAKNKGVDLERFAAPLAKITAGQHTPEEITPEGIKHLLAQWKAGSAEVEAYDKDAASRSWLSFFTADNSKRKEGLKSEASARQSLSDAIKLSVGAALVPLHTPSAVTSDTTAKTR